MPDPELSLAQQARVTTLHLPLDWATIERTLDAADRKIAEYHADGVSVAHEVVAALEAARKVFLFARLVQRDYVEQQRART